jgi:hemolysin D
MGKLAKSFATVWRTGKTVFFFLFRSPQGAHTDQDEFAPDILRVQNTPPRPMPRVVLGITLTLVGVALLWAAFGRLDIIAVAQGKLVPQSSLKIVQPAEAGIVKEILVQEGQHVKAGQILMRMDPTLSLADLNALRSELQQKSIAIRRIDAELANQPFVAEPDDSPQLFREAQAQYLANRRAQQAAVAQEQAAWERSKQEMAAAQETKKKLEQTLPHYRTQDEAFQKLVKEGFAGRILAEDKARERIEKEQDYRTQSFVVAREHANMALSQTKIAQLESDYLRRLRDERAELTDRVQRLQQEVAKQDHRYALLELKAPQDGRVKDLATHTVGTVAQPGTILMTLVPVDESLLAEVWLSNEDVGFVRPGQAVKLKLASFQFQKYGMLDARIEQIAADAADRQEAGAEQGERSTPLAYRTSIALDKQVLKVNDISYRLASGMQVSAEIKLGERTVLEYLLSPVTKAFHEAARER